MILFIVKGAKVTIMWIQFTWTHLHLPTRIYVEQSVTYGRFASLVVFDPSPKRDALLCLKCDEIVWVNSCATTHYTPVSISSMFHHGRGQPNHCALFKNLLRQGF